MGLSSGAKGHLGRLLYDGLKERGSKSATGLANLIGALFTNNQHY
jgi:hypothetical protein